MRVSGLFRAVKKAATKHLPELLIGDGIGGFISAVGFALEEGTEIKEAIEEKKEQLNVEKLPIKESAKIYISKGKKTAIATVAGTTLIVAGANVGHSRTVAAAMGGLISETAADAFKDTAKEVVGDKKVREIEERVAEKKVNENQKIKEYGAVGPGMQLCIEPLTGQPFESTVNDIKAAFNDLNEMINNEQYISVTDYFDRMAIEMPVRLDYWDELGWNSQIRVVFATVMTADDRPAVTYEFEKVPRYDYRDLYGI